MNAPVLPHQGVVFAAEERQPWVAARNILVIRLDNLGDVVMTSPAIAALRTHAKSVRVTLLASPATAALSDSLDFVDRVIPFSAAWMKTTAAERGSTIQMVDVLRHERFDAAIIFTVCTQSALPAAMLCEMAGIPLRLAYARENPYGLLTHWVKDREWPGEFIQHEVERQAALVESVGFICERDRLRIACSDADRDSVRRCLQHKGLSPDEPYLLLHPGATAASRRYPIERFAQIARQASLVWRMPVIIAGGPDDKVAETALQRSLSSRIVSLVGKLSLGELIALIDGAAALICNNSGPAHLAAALKTPSVVLYAQTNPQHKPWSDKAVVLTSAVPCANCLQSVCPVSSHPCLTQIGVADVLSALQRVLRRSALQEMAAR